MTKREKPYGNYNFLVEIGEIPPDAPEGGFAEVILPESSIEVITYRNGNAKTTDVLKIPGRVTHANLILRRGVMGFSNLYDWWNDTRNGPPEQFRTVMVTLHDENHQTVMQWKFSNAWPNRLKYGPLLGDGDQVVIEELEITFERMDVNFA